MATITPEQFAMLLPLACVWAAEQEAVIIKTGVPLTDSQTKDASRVGVMLPEKVRLLRVAQMPLPRHPALATAAKATGLISPNTVGLTFRHGIFIRTDSWENRLVIVHELVHTSQYERLGGFEQFLRPYIMECVTPPGYPHGPLEQEAVTTAAKICGLG